MALKGHLGTEDESVIRAVENKAQVIGYMRLLRRTVRRSEEAGAQEKIAYYKKRLIEVLGLVDTLEF